MSDTGHDDLPERIDKKARKPGDRYVLTEHVNGRRIKPYVPNAWERWGRDVLADPYTEISDDLMERAQVLIEEDRETRENYARQVEQAKSGIERSPGDTLVPVVRSLQIAGSLGMTSAEIERENGLSHGIVSSRLSFGQQSGKFERLAE